MVFLNSIMASFMQKKIIIKGGTNLKGSITVSGAKNAALPQMAAALLAGGPVQLSNLPRVDDVFSMHRALQFIGLQGEWSGNEISLSLAGNRLNPVVPAEIARSTRASVLLLGPLLARCGEARVSFPGGCSIGERKIDFHLEGLRRMGAVIDFEDEYIIARASTLRGIEYRFPQKTVTGTENLLMAAVMARGGSVLDNCALEPEISDLIDLLSAGGAEIKGRGTERISVSPCGLLSPLSHVVIPDRIEAGTYLIAGALPGNELLLHGARLDHLDSLLQVLESIGVSLSIEDQAVRISGKEPMRPAKVATRPYPGFPTDLQAQLTTLLTQASGESEIEENIFNDRFKHTFELNKLGARIRLSGNRALISGPSPLRGTTIRTTDLRASAALVLGGLLAAGETILENAAQLFRGYELMAEKLQKTGAMVKIIEE